MRKWITFAGALACTVALFVPAVSTQAPAGEGGGPGGARGGGRGGRGAPEPVIPVHPRDLSGYWMLPPDPARRPQHP